MRLIAALLTVAWLTACGAAPSQPEQALLRFDDGWRQQQAILDADAILQGMAQARQRRQEVARSAR
jgi:hypothetical protein